MDHRLIFALSFSIVFLGILYLISGKGIKAAWVDLGWSMTIGALGLYFSIAGEGDLTRRVIFGSMILVWSLRLSSHLYRDRIKGSKVDTRYVQLRQDWGKDASKNFLIFFQVQAILAFLLALPFFIYGNCEEPISKSFIYISLAIFFLAVSGEWLADHQLHSFKKCSNSGEVCSIGLWKYSRHPNYFFEWLHWVAYIFMALDTQYWWVSLLVASVMLFLILFVTGIPPTEAQSLISRGAKYRQYQKATSEFIPWFPKKLIEEDKNV